MLGIVCKSYAEALHFEKHESDGSVNNAYGLHALAAERGMSINKQYLVFCLENIRYCNIVHLTVIVNNNLLCW